MSYKDFETHLKSMKIQATSEEIQAIMKNVLDTNQDGYVPFKEFSKRFGPNMSRTIEVKENQSKEQYLQPSKEMVSEFSRLSKSVRPKFE